jgi:hypothetical protein
MKERKSFSLRVVEESVFGFAGFASVSFVGGVEVRFDR